MKETLGHVIDLVTHQGFLAALVAFFGYRMWVAEKYIKRMQGGQ